jgi:hypothetical protein
MYATGMLIPMAGGYNIMSDTAASMAGSADAADVNEASGVPGGRRPLSVGCRLRTQACRWKVKKDETDTAVDGLSYI